MTKLLSRVHGTRRSFRFALICLLAFSSLASARAANILYVVSNPAAPIGNDPEVIDRLTTLKGHTVDLVDDDDATLATKDLSPYALVLISSSVGSGGAGVNPLCRNLATGRIPVVCYEPGDYDELLMQTATTFGNAGGHTTITISTNFASHPLAAGKRGTISIVEEGSTATLSYRPDAGIPGGDPILIAFNANVDVGRLNLWAYEKGSRLADGTTVATSRRVATFFNASTAAGVYNTNAWDLFDASINWALQPPPNLPITASLRSPAAQNAAANAPVVVDLDDGSTTQAVTNSISLALNGTNVTASVSRTNKITTVAYTPSGLYPSGSTNTVRVIYTNNDTPPKTATNTFTFIVANYVSIPAAQRITGTPNASAPGFSFRAVQGPVNPPTFINSAARAEAQLANTWIDRNTGLPFPNEATPGPAGGFYNVDTVINFDQAQGNLGNFTAANGFPEALVPGIGATGHTSNYAAEILTYLELAAGFYTFGVNSDDGFVLYTGPDARDVLASSVGRFDGARGAADTIFGFNVEAPGVYSFRLLWYQGDGGSNIEFFSVDSQTGQKILINAAGNAKAIKAYRQVTGTRPYIRSVNPLPDATAVDVNGAVTFTLADGDAQVATNTIRLTFDNTTVTPTALTKTGGQTTVSYDPPGVMLNFSRHTAQLTYGDNGTPALTRTVSLTFQTGAGSPLLQSAAGLVVWEAEDYDTNTVSVTHEWIAQASPAGFSGRTAMYASPDAPGAVIETPDGFVTSPQLSYRVNFVKTGTHYFWFRGSDGGGNSINAGIDDVDPSGTTMANIDDFAACCGTRVVPGGTSFVWVGGIDATTAGRASFEVPAVGVHTIHVWMREDGQIVDKLLVTTDANFVPTGAGPEASGRVGQTPPTISITSPTTNQTFAANSNISITVNAADSDGTVAKVEFFADANLIGESSVAPFSFTWTNVPSGRYVLSARATDNTGVNARSANVEIVVGTPPPEALFLTGGTATASDLALMARLRELGFVVRAVVDAASQTSDANNKALIVISSTVGSGNIATKFTASPVPLINWESAVYDDLGMELNNVAGATIATQTTIEIVDASHPLAGGIGTGIKTVYTVAGDISTLTDVVLSAKVVARATDGTSRPVIFGIEKGAAMNTARIATAPERRVGIFLANDTYVTATADGKKLFDAAVSWATGGSTTGGSQPKFNAPTLSANGVTISWTGSGTLEQTDSLTPPNWAAAPSQANPQTVPATGIRFYRIRQ